MAKYQFTMFSDKHKPVATIVEANSRLDFVREEKPFMDAIQAICAKRRWSMADLKRYGYKNWKVRKVEKEEEIVEQ